MVVVVAATPNYLRQASQNLGKYPAQPVPGHVAGAQVPAGSPRRGAAAPRLRGGARQEPGSPPWGAAGSPGAGVEPRLPGVEPAAPHPGAAAPHLGSRGAEGVEPGSPGVEPGSPGGAGLVGLGSPHWGARLHPKMPGSTPGEPRGAGQNFWVSWILNLARRSDTARAPAGERSPAAGDPRTWRSSEPVQARLQDAQHLRDRRATDPGTVHPTQPTRTAAR